MILCLNFVTVAKSQNLNQRTYNAKNISNEPIVDGKEDNIWKEIEPTSNFIQYKPNNGKSERSGFESEVKIAYGKKISTFLLN